MEWFGNNGLENASPDQRHHRQIGRDAFIEKAESRFQNQRIAGNGRFLNKSTASLFETGTYLGIEIAEIQDLAERQEGFPVVPGLHLESAGLFGGHTLSRVFICKRIPVRVSVNSVVSGGPAFAAVEAAPSVTFTISRVLGEGAVALCFSRAGQTVVLPRASMPRIGDQLTIVPESARTDETVSSPPAEPVPAGASKEGQNRDAAGGEVLPWRPAEFCLTRSRDRHATVIQTQVGYIPIPKSDKNGDPGIRIPLDKSGLDLRAIYLPCRAIRDYFFVPDRRSPWDRGHTLYEELRVPPQSTFADLNAAFRLRRLELERQQKPAEITSLERVYNLLAIPPLRFAYDELLLDPDRPADFPGAGFGTLIIGGTRRADTFFVERILAFRPERTTKIFLVPFRKIEFCVGYAVVHDPREKKEIFLDPHSLHLDWDPTWNQWRQYIGRKIRISAECVRTGRYRKTAGAWDYSDWYTALPSRTTVVMPEELRADIEKAQKAYRRFGRFQRDISALRQQVQRRPLEAAEIKRLCWERGLPGDFDVRLIIWKPEFEEFYYDQLKQHALSLYLWREEFIFELEHMLVVEIPQAGRASYIFNKPVALDRWLTSYVRTSRAEIRKNQGNAAEVLGFVGRLVHGRKPANWWKELLQKTGEAVSA